MTGQVDISVILCTYNRCDLLEKSVASVLAQDCAGIKYELLIVDNNSSDDTRAVCERFIAQSPIAIHYLFEPRQGVSYARNTAIARAKAPIIAFFDDDVCVSPSWIADIKRAFDERPEIDGVGGKVLPRWQATPPAWLTPAQWAPLALQDYGDAPIRIDRANPLCLVAANLALRSRVFERIGLFTTALQRVKNSIGSMEDHELHVRLWDAGYTEMYRPELVVTAEVQAERLTRQYHRRWHKGHGHFYALMREGEFERSAFRLFDVPGHLYRQTLVNLLGWGKAQLSGNREKAFSCETGCYFFTGFFQQRLAAPGSAKRFMRLRRLGSALHSLVRRRAGLNNSNQ
jgi:GT2 family glycosyltransferase